MKIQTGFLVAAVLFFSAPSFSQIGFKQDERIIVQKFKASNGKLEEGKNLFAKGNYDKARKKFLECLDIFPKNADAQFFMAKIYLKENDLENARQSIESAKANFSELGKLYSFTHQEMLNDLREQKSEVEESIRKEEEVLSSLGSRTRSESTELDVQNMTGAMMANKNLIAKIDAQLQNPIPMIMETPVEYFYIHGNILFKQKDFQGAAIQYLETVKRNPRHEFAYNNLASIFFMAKQYEKAREFLLQAEANGVAVNPKFKQAIEEKLGIK